MCGSVTCDTPVINSTIQILSWVSDQSESDRSETQLKIWMVLLVTEVSQATLPQIYQKP